MNQDVLDCLEKLDDFVADVGEYLVCRQRIPDDVDISWHAYFCGYSRGIKEFLAYGPHASYEDVYSSFDRYVDERDVWFHEGLVNGLAMCIKLYCQVEA